LAGRALSRFQGSVLLLRILTTTNTTFSVKPQTRGRPLAGRFGDLALIAFIGRAGCSTRNARPGLALLRLRDVAIGAVVGRQLKNPLRHDRRWRGPRADGATVHAGIQWASARGVELRL